MVEIVKTWRVRRQCEKRFMASISCLPNACSPLNKILLYTFNSIAAIYQAHETLRRERKRRTQAITGVTLVDGMRFSFFYIYFLGKITVRYSLTL